MLQMTVKTSLICLYCLMYMCLKSDCFTCSKKGYISRKLIVMQLKHNFRVLAETTIYCILEDKRVFLKIIE